MAGRPRKNYHVPEIHSGIPIPEGPQPISHELRRMGVADSIFFRGMSSRSREVRCVYKAGYRLGWKFTIKTRPNGVWLWRVS